MVHGHFPLEEQYSEDCLVFSCLLSPLLYSKTAFTHTVDGLKASRARRKSFIIGALVLVILIIMISYSRDRKESGILLAPLEDTKGVTVLIWEQPSRHAGARKLLWLEHISIDCQEGKPECGTVQIPNCPVRCEWTTNQSRVMDANVLFFHGDYRIARAPPVIKPKGQKYSIFGHEPTWQRPRQWRNPDWTKQFDIAFHWARGSDIQLNFYYFDTYHFSRDPGEWWKVANVTKWPEWFENRNLRPLTSAMVSNCESEERNEFMRRYMGASLTASYGLCLNNIKGDNQFEDFNKDPTRMDSKMILIGMHPFHLAMESAVEPGWVTEKIFQALYAGTVPVYYGASQDVRKLVPPNSFVDAGLFSSPEEVAAHVEEVAKNVTLYMEYHEWRKDESAIRSLFKRLHREGRVFAPCRLCEYYLATQNVELEGELRFSIEEGWYRHKPKSKSS